VKQTNVRGRLIDNTISVIAAYGLDKTTTKAIVGGTNINEAYIYRYFHDKDSLLATAFDKLDAELVEITSSYVHLLGVKELDIEARCRLFFKPVWEFLLGNKEKCLAFIRYYYSPYFRKYSAESHKERYGGLIESFDEVFREEANTWMLLNHILNVMLSFAIKVFDDSVANDDDTAEHVFRLVYYSTKPYFKKEDGNNEDEESV